MTKKPGYPWHDRFVFWFTSRIRQTDAPTPEEMRITAKWLEEIPDHILQHWQCIFEDLGKVSLDEMKTAMLSGDFKPVVFVAPDTAGKTSAAD